jgi:hypothetical protein
MSGRTLSVLVAAATAAAAGFARGDGCDLPGAEEK